MIKLIIFTTLLLSLTAQATLYIAAYDTKSNSWGIGYSSSGANFRINTVKDKGIIGFGSYGRCRQIPVTDVYVLFEKNLNAKELTTAIYNECKLYGWEKFRMTAVTSDGTLSSVIAREGCHRSNSNCGERVSNTFVITAGGLAKGVHDKVNSYFKSISHLDIPLECKLYKTLKVTYAKGGEKLQFNGAAIIVDSLEKEKISNFRISRPRNKNESFMLQHLRNQMHVAGFKCD